MTKVRFVDTTLRDGNQCLWATRMRTATMLPALGALDRAGFDAVELMGLVHFDAPVRYLKEDPWERIRLVREKVTKTPLQSLMRSRCLLGFDQLADDINHLWIERLIANGIRRIVAFDGLHDWDNIASNLRVAHEFGATTGAWLTYSLSPVHTDDFYVRKAQDLLAAVPTLDLVTIEDASGVLTVDRVRTLVPAIKAVIGDRPLELHGHCLTGEAPLVYLEGAVLGADVLYTCVPPLADAAAPPSVQQVSRNLRRLGFDDDLDDVLLSQLRDHFTEAAERHEMPIGAPVEHDVFQFEHQMAGGVVSNLKQQLAVAGIGHRFEEVLHESARVRKDLGWPIVVTPFAQLMVTQSVLNVVHGERYKVVADEIKKYVLGYYGEPPSAVDPDVLDRIVEVGSQRIAPVPPQREPVVDRLRKQYPDASDDERLLRFVFAGSQVDDLIAAGPIQTSETSALLQPLAALLTELAKRPQITALRYVGNGVNLDLKASPALHRASS